MPARNALPGLKMYKVWRSHDSKYEDYYLLEYVILAKNVTSIFSIEEGGSRFLLNIGTFFFFYQTTRMSVIFLK
jgi:hypothetical protein